MKKPKKVKMTFKQRLKNAESGLRIQRESLAMTEAMEKLAIVNARRYRAGIMLKEIMVDNCKATVAVLEHAIKDLDDIAGDLVAAGGVQPNVPAADKKIQDLRAGLRSVLTNRPEPPLKFTAVWTAGWPSPEDIRKAQEPNKAGKL